MAESSRVRLQTIKQDTERQLNEHYKNAIQYSEQLEDNQWQLDFCRGATEATATIVSYLDDGDLNQALLRLQSLRVETYCTLSEHFKAMVLLKRQQARNDQQLAFYQGMASVDGKGNDAGQKVLVCCQNQIALNEQLQANDERVHFYRGMIAALDEGERVINEELNPKKIPGGVPTSPGAVGPDFTGQAMPKPAPDKVKFPTYTEEQILPNYAEYQPKAFGHDKLEEIK